MGKQTRTKRKRRTRHIGGHVSSVGAAEGATDGDGAGLHCSSSSAVTTWDGLAGGSMVEGGKQPCVPCRWEGEHEKAGSGGAEP
eukprot:1139738-Pelagomonas_calceolata.AAC.3